MYIYQNYHKHSERTNPVISDSTVTYQEYANRAVKLGHGILSSAEHGYQGRYIEAYDVAKEQNLKCLIGAEAYWVEDRTKPDNSNCHIWIGAKNENGRQALNDILSEASLSGFYYRPRIDVPLILSLPKDDVWVTSACVAYWKYPNADAITEEFANHFGENFYLEVQYHNTESQKQINKHILELHDRLKAPLIMGCDSHYITKDQAQIRDDFLVSKGIKYEDEEGWFLDYPDGDTAYTRFVEQGILRQSDIVDAIANTNTFLDVAEYENPIFNTDIKLPTLYDGEHTVNGVPFPKLDQNGRDEVYKKLVWQGWNTYKKDIPESDWVKYETEIQKEIQTVIDCHMSDYFIDNYYIIKRGKENGGWLTKTGRGCFAPGALVHTTETLKPIEEVQAGDMIFDMNGEVKKVLNICKYPVREDMIQIHHCYSAGIEYPLICTKDHKILIYRNKERIWIKAEDVKDTDYVVCPKIHIKGKEKSVIDLNEYNTFGFDYDDAFIYEYNPYKNNEYLYSPTDVAKHIGCSDTTIQKIANGFISSEGRSERIQDALLKYTGFTSVKEYADYVRSMRTIRINRYIQNDDIFNMFIGMMYGDGFCGESKITVGLAYNTQNEKSVVNKSIFYEIANRVGLQVRDGHRKNKALGQCSVNSKIFSEYVKKELFVSKKGECKRFNINLLQQNKENVRALLKGLEVTDGSKCESTRVSFDNTSLSIINAFKIGKMIIGDEVVSLSKRNSWMDKRGYRCNDSYKLRCYRNTNNAFKSSERTLSDKKYYYLPIISTDVIKNYNGYVYDLEVEDSHSYLIYNMVVHNSAVSNFTNNLLGFTEVDRIAAKVKMYPERFMSADRILKSGSLPDIDFNVAPVEPFLQAQKDILGEDHAYPMIAYGTYQKSAAWKLYAKAKGVDFETANTVSEQLKRYEMAVKHADEDTKDDIDVYHFIDKKFQKIYEDSKEYMGLITSWSIAPSASLLYQGSIRKEIGLIRIKENLCCLMDGAWAEKNHLLKNDLLKVSVVDLIYRSYHRAGIEPPPQKELLEMAHPDDPTWKLYENGCTLGLNQVEQPGTSSRVGKYAPKNISELCAFVAAIRPGFKSMYKIFETKEHFDYGVKQFDDLIQTEEMPNSFLLYQEHIMAALAYAGIPMSEGYTVIKAISKKRVEKIMSYKDRFIDGFSAKLVEDGVSNTEAKPLSEKLWQIIEDSSSYSFNASHSYCVSLDSVYSAWIKAHHPLAFYETLLQIQEAKGDKDKMVEIRREAESYFKITFPPYRFGQDNRAIRANMETGEITNSIQAIKGLPKVTGDLLWNVAQTHPKNMTETLFRCKEQKVSDAAIQTLARIGYFSCFGNDIEILRTIELFHFFKEGTAKLIKNTSVDNPAMAEILLRYAKPGKSSYTITNQKIESCNTAIKELKKEIKKHEDNEELTAMYTTMLEDKLTEEMELRKDHIQKMLIEMENRIHKAGFPDLDFRNKIANQTEILGYADLTTGKEEDRRKLVVEEVTPLKNKTTQKIWCYRLHTKSIGSGKSASLSVRPNVYEETPVQKGDVIFTPVGSLKKNDKGYWYLYWYDLVV